MTISRMQQPRQLYGLGSLVKKITKPIKKIVKSPIGKAALTGAAIYFGGGGGNPFTAAGRSKFGSNVFGSFLKDSILGKQIARGEKGITREGGIFNLIKNFAVDNPGKAALLGLGAAGVAAPFFFGKDEEEEIVEDPFSVTPSSIADIRQMARNRDPSLAFLPQQQFVQPGFYAAEGGRAQLAGGGGRIQQLITLMRDAKDKGDMDTADMIKADIFKEFGLRMNKGGTPREMLAGGSKKKPNMAELTSFEENLPLYATGLLAELGPLALLLQGFKKGGIADLPQVRMLEGGMPEIDYRQSGGFVPVGKKEKADDVPAMLSKNEFVMTADAVRGMGDGNVEKGAQRMYDQMKQLENRVA